MGKRLGAHVIANMVVGVLLAVDFVVIMASALVEEAPHEYLGVILLALLVAHIVLNRRWFAALVRGRWTAVRVLQVVAILGVLGCLIAQMASAVVLSKYAFGFLPAVPGASWARSAHMLCSYWGFVFAFAHVGLQFKNMLAKSGASRKLRGAAVVVLRIVWLVIAAAGVWSFAQMGLADYLLARVQFAMADFATPLWGRCAEYASVVVLIAGVFHYLRCALDRAHRNASKPTK